MARRLAGARLPSEEQVEPGRGVRGGLEEGARVVQSVVGDRDQAGSASQASTDWQDRAGRSEWEEEEGETSTKRERGRELRSAYGRCGARAQGDDGGTGT